MKCVSYCNNAQDVEVCLECAEHYALEIQYNNWKNKEARV